MSDLARYTKERAARDPEFAAGLESGYAEFRIEIVLRDAREGLNPPKRASTV